MDSSRQIEDTAAAWMIRRDGGQWSSSEEAELKAWLNTSLAHKVAYLRLEAAWESSSRLQALGAGIPSGVVPPPGKWRVSPLFRSRQADGAASRSKGKWFSMAIAASLVILLGAGMYWRWFLEGDRYATPTGAMASIALQDGSKVTLNTASRIRVVLNKQERVIKLDGGEAFFDVAKEAARPFIVEAANRRIVAVGTRFSVRCDGDDVRVVVTEGKVRFEPDPSTGRPTVLAAGAVARARQAALNVSTETLHDAEEVLSWRTGYLKFDAIPLSEAVAEFNRYTQRKIVIRDESVAALHVSGKFRTTSAEAFIRMLHDGFGVQVQSEGATVVLKQ